MSLLLSFLVLVMLPSSLQNTDVGPRLIDRIIADSAFRSFPRHHARTAQPYRVQLPSNLSGITADVARLRAGSMRRHGASINEFSVAPGVVIRPHMKRIIAVRQNLGNHSYIYTSYQNISGYRLVSPVLGLLMYDAANVGSNSTAYPSELEFFVKRKPLRVDFSKIISTSVVNISMCATFQLDGRLILSNLTDRSVCVAWKQGHFAVVVESKVTRESGNKVKQISKGKIIAMSAIGGALGAALLGLVVVAMVNVRRKKFRIAELDRRAYEEAALQVSMVGHVRAPTAAAARTMPALENAYSPTS